MTWADCALVQQAPDILSGRPVIRGTRVLAESIVEDADAGSPMSELRENYPAVPEETIAAVLKYARSQKRQPQP